MYFQNEYFQSAKSKLKHLRIRIAQSLCSFNVQCLAYSNIP